MQTRRSSQRASTSDLNENAISKQNIDATGGTIQLPSPVSEPGQTTTMPFIESMSERVKRRKTTSSSSSADASFQKPSTTISSSRKRKRIPVSQPALVPVAVVPEPPSEIHPESETVAHTSMSIDAVPEESTQHTTRRSEHQAFADVVVQELHEAAKDHADNIGLRQIKRVLGLLRIAKPALEEDAPWLTEEEAIAVVRPGNLHTGPIFVENQQPHNLVTVKEFLTEFYDNTATIWIQDSAAAATGGTTRQVAVGEVKDRLSKAPSQYPWNCLELASPIEDGIRPRFLNESECRLLTKIKTPPKRKGSKTATVGRRSLMPGYKEVEKWVLLAESGALTEPHQDSHGYNTYITMNEGSLGFGWLHQPSPAERQEWMDHPESFQGGTWRYAVLRPGQTVYFPAGTVHFVFRLRSAGHTLAFGGHVLRCSTIVPWAEALLLEKRHPYIANEDLTESALGFLDQVEKFVLQAKASNDSREANRWGGLESIEQFLALKKTFTGPKRSR